MDFSTTITNLFNALSNLNPPQSNPNERRIAVHERKPNVLTLLTQTSSAVAKHVFLTLHFLFPHDLLPALDLLDRGLVNCFFHETVEQDSQRKCHPSASHEVYYIQSASAVTENPTARQSTVNPTESPFEYINTTTRASSSTGRYRNALRPKPTDTFYEVRLDSWNCSCAAFAFNALSQLSLPDGSDSVNGPAITLPVQSPRGEDSRPTSTAAAAETHRPATVAFRFGGQETLPHAPSPICKHVLAACVARALPNWAWPAVDMRSGMPWRREAGSKEEMAGWGAGWGDA